MRIEFWTDEPDDRALRCLGLVGAVGETELQVAGVTMSKEGEGRTRWTATFLPCRSVREFVRYDPFDRDVVGRVSIPVYETGDLDPLFRDAFSVWPQAELPPPEEP